VGSQRVVAAASGIASSTRLADGKRFLIEAQQRVVALPRSR
jgi:hypothetical protein